MQIGIIAGCGDLPKIISQDAKQRGYEVVIIALEGLASPELNNLSDKIKWVNAGKLGEIISILKNYGISSLLMAGKVPKSLLIKGNLTPDMKAIKLLFSLRNKSDSEILNAISDELKKEGIKVIDTAIFSPHLLTPEGFLTERKPSDSEQKDINFGFKVAKEIGRLDIGQTVVVKSQAVMAVEAIEGTDEAILRGGRLAGEGAVVVKVSKPQQDMRLDVPVVGPDTIKAMISVRASVLALEAQKSIIIDRDSVIKISNLSGISIIGLNWK
ncbi:MAG: UDP-2,3-diacylglucosamine diphosphatase LpxI [Thermodesulfovibrionales bacterium]|nr:UDP-2,3-diacylglucosamine diphosphatase LpxI [Thermodesulfovibrionales bacterium]